MHWSRTLIDLPISWRRQTRQTILLDVPASNTCTLHTVRKFPNSPNISGQHHYVDFVRRLATKCRHNPTAFTVHRVISNSQCHCPSQAKDRVCHAVLPAAVNDASTTSTAKSISQKLAHLDAENAQIRLHSCPDPEEIPDVYNYQQYAVQKI